MESGSFEESYLSGHECELSPWHGASGLQEGFLLTLQLSRQIGPLAKPELLMRRQLSKINDFVYGVWCGPVHLFGPSAPVWAALVQQLQQ